MPVAKTETKLSKSLASGGTFLKKIERSLQTIFYIVWILIGIFVALIIVLSYRQGAFTPLFTSPQQPQQQIQPPTETTLPGIGKVNIACVQQSLSEEAITKIVQEQGTDSLTDEEKTSLEPCIIEKESSPEPTP